MKRPDVMINNHMTRYKDYVPSVKACDFAVMWWRLREEPTESLATLIDLMLHGY